MVVRSKPKLMKFVFEHEKIYETAEIIIENKNPANCGTCISFEFKPVNKYTRLHPGSIAHAQYLYQIFVPCWLLPREADRE